MKALTMTYGPALPSREGAGKGEGGGGLGHLHSASFSCGGVFKETGSFKIKPALLPAVLLPAPPESAVLRGASSCFCTRGWARQGLRPGGVATQPRRGGSDSPRGLQRALSSRPELLPGLELQLFPQGKNHRLEAAGAAWGVRAPPAGLSGAALPAPDLGQAAATPARQLYFYFLLSVGCFFFFLFCL